MRMGFLDGFFECQACDMCPTNVLSMVDIEDLYPVTYVQGKSITVQMDERDIIFVCREKMHVADFSDWIGEDCSTTIRLQKELCLMTVMEREALYTRKDGLTVLQGKFPGIKIMYRDFYTALR
jgi:hypothetical protein